MTNYGELSDHELISCLKQGDHAAFTEIYDRYWEMAADAAWQRLRSREDAEEIVQDVFVSLYIRRAHVNPKVSLDAYLKTAVKYRIIDAYRSQQLHYAHIDNLIRESSVSAASPEDQLDIKELRQRVMRAADKLPDKCREVFKLSRFEQLTHQEIADRTGISVSTVKKHLHKALQILKAEFKDTSFDLMLVCVLLFSF